MKYVILAFPIGEEADEFVEDLQADPQIPGNVTHLVPQLDLVRVIAVMEAEGKPNGEDGGPARSSP